MRQTWVRVVNLVGIAVLLIALMPQASLAQSPGNIPEKRELAPCFICVFLPFLKGDFISYENGWTNETLADKELIVSPDPLSANTIASGSLQLVATASIGGSSSFVYLAQSGMTSVAAIGVAVLVVFGIDTIPEHHNLLSQQTFSFVRQAYVQPTDASAWYDPDQIDRQEIVVDWRAPAHALQSLVGQEVSLVDTALRPLIADHAIVADVAVDGQERFIITYGWGSEDLEVIKTHGYEAMNKAVYDLPFYTYPPTLPEWASDERKGIFSDGSVYFTDPSKAIVGTEGALVIDHFVAEYINGYREVNGEIVLDIAAPSGIVLIEGEVWNIYRSEDIANKSSKDEDEVTGWTALEKRVKEIREQERDLRKAKPAIPDHPIDPDDMPNIPDKKYRACPAWEPVIDTITWKDRNRHPDPVLGAQAAYEYLVEGMQADASPRTSLLGYYLVEAPGEEPFLATGLARRKVVYIAGRGYVGVWAIQVWKFNNVRRQDENLADKFEWFQASTYFRTYTDSPYTEHMVKLWRNRPSNPPQYTGVCGYFENGN